jgi:hypothetical protein
MTAISIFRGCDDPRFDESDRGWLGRLIPHVSRSLGFMQRLELRRAQAAATRAALDRLPFGVLLLSRDMAIAQMNAAAIEMLARGDGLGVDAAGSLEGACSRIGLPGLATWLHRMGAVVARPPLPNPASSAPEQLPDGSVGPGHEEDRAVSLYDVDWIDAPAPARSAESLESGPVGVDAMGHSKGAGEPHAGQDRAAGFRDSRKGMAEGAQRLHAPDAERAIRIAESGVCGGGEEECKRQDGARGPRFHNVSCGALERVPDDT